MKKILTSISIFLILFFLYLIAYSPISILERYRDAVVLIKISSGSSGTGFYLTIPNSNKDIIITAWHVCNAIKPHYGTSINDVDDFKIIKINPKVDLCAIQVTKGLIPDKLYLGSTLVAEDIVYTMGHPRSGDLTFSAGEYKRIDEGFAGFFLEPGEDCPNTWEKILLYKVYYACRHNMMLGKTNLKVDAGWSGGPVLNVYGNVVGVVNSMDNKNNAHIIMLDDLVEFVQKL